MPQNSFETIAMLCSICGFIMVAGGLFLLYKGIINLPKASDVASLSLEVKNAMKDFKVSTTTPALSFFIIGLLFITIPLLLTKPEGPRPIRFKAQLAGGVIATAYVKANTWSLPESSTDGLISGTIVPSLDDLIIEVSAPGHSTYKKVIGKSTVQNDTIDLGNINMTEVLDRNQVAKSVVSIDEGVVLEPLDSAPAFGVSSANE